MSWDDELQALKAAASEAQKRQDDPPPQAETAAVVVDRMLAGIPRPSPEAIAAGVARSQREQERARGDVLRAMLSELPAGYRFARFGADEAWLSKAPFAERPRVVSQCRALAVRAPTPSIVWAGATAQGKTSLLVATADRWARHHVGESLMYVSSLRLARARELVPLGQGESPAVERAIAVDLLLLDDLGQEQGGKSSPIVDVLYERHEQGRPTWVTTWCTVEELVVRYGAGIARRLMDDRVSVLTWADG